MIDTIRNRLIDRILATKNENFLIAIENIFISTQKEDEISLNSEQIEMLNMSEQDIKNTNIISEKELEKEDAKWLK
ncbi:MAG: hypothetical protein GXO49_02995 [Chlorobi bacterium]|nr:hypothetical protein [Chlorobiota bacterium]